MVIRTILTALAVGSVLFAGQPALGQSLSDRIETLMALMQFAIASGGGDDSQVQ